MDNYPNLDTDDLTKLAKDASFPLNENASKRHMVNILEEANVIGSFTPGYVVDRYAHLSIYDLIDLAIVANRLRPKGKEVFVSSMMHKYYIVEILEKEGILS